MTRNAKLDAVTFPPKLAVGETSKISGTMTSIGDEPTNMIVDLIDISSGKVMASVSTGGPMPPFTMIPFELQITMPNYTLRFELRLHD